MATSRLTSSELSENFTWAEAVVTSHRTIKNTLPAELKSNVTFTAQRLEVIRSLLNASILINSWYRSPELNTAVGGSKTSAHKEGRAVDFIAPRFGTPLAVCQKIAKYSELVGFEQLIYEHTWVHISFSTIPGAKPKLQVLTLMNGGKYSTGLIER